MLLGIILAVGSLIIMIIIGKPIAQIWSRRRLYQQPIPTAWQLILEQIPLYIHLPSPLKQQLQGHLQILLAEKRFIGCAGLEITDEIKVTIAAQACLLLLNRKTYYYKNLYSILIYPSTFVVNQEESDFAGVHTYKRRVLLGESWDSGKIVIAWHEVKRDTKNFGDGSNVVLHEFAHQLDSESGKTNGAPLLENKASYATWANRLSQEYDWLCQQVARNQYTVINHYGTEDPAEFFAVITETFFEKPLELKHERSKLYEQLRNYYKVDPSEW